MKKTLIIIGLSTVLLACGQSESEIYLNAKKNAEEYAKNLGANAKVLSCSSQDSDKNGYVSCDIDRGNGSTVSVECAYKSGAIGCKSK